MNIEAKIHSLDKDEFFGIGSKNIFVIPKYQRPYTWGDEQCETLFNDVTGHSEGYFLGSMLCVPIENYEHNNKAQNKNFVGLEVVDGQQRLTTICIFLVAIHNVLKEYEKSGVSLPNDFSKNFSRYLIVSGSDLVIGDVIVFSRIFPQTNNNNRQQYLHLLQAEFNVSFGVPKDIKIDKSIHGAFETFKKCLKEYVEPQKTLEDKRDAVLKIYQKLIQVKMVRIIAQNHSDAYALFEALNDRGVPLVMCDLLKNQILSKLSAQIKNEENKKKLMNNYLECWNERIIGKILKNNNTEQERFFRQIYNAYRKKWLADYPALGEKLKPAEHSNLLNVYEEIIKYPEVDIRKFLDDLSEAAKFYSQIHVKNEEIFDDVANRSFEDLRQIKGGTSGTLLIYLMLNREKFALGNAEFIKICTVLEKFFVRRSFTGKPASSSMDDIFIELIDAVEKNNGKNIEKILLEQLKAVSADDEDFERELRRDVYSGKPGLDYRTRFVLGKIANKHIDPKEPKNFWSKKEKWQIEHIMPQKLNPSKIKQDPSPNYWIDLLGNGDKNKAESVQKDYLHKLGNLTLTKYNSKMSNCSFPYKKEIKENGVRVGLALFKDDGGLNSDVYYQEDWTPIQIENRTNRLIKEILKEIFNW